jgi:hypothetical protein
MLSDCLAHVSLTDAPDVRHLFYTSAKEFSSRIAYADLHQDCVPDDDAHRLWHTRLPNKVRFFAWLLHKGRLNSRAQLCHWNNRCPEESNCERCVDTLETMTHIFVECPSAAEIWTLTGIHVDGNSHMLPWFLGKELDLPTEVRLDAVVVLHWHIWKARNALIFDHQNSIAVGVVRKVISNLDSSACRYNKHRPHLRCWRDYVLSRI